MNLEDMVDGFISECLLPTTHHKEVTRNQEIYDWYIQWAEYADLPMMKINVFGKYIAKRFHRTRRGGKVYYFCKLNPKVVD